MTDISPWAYVYVLCIMYCRIFTELIRQEAEMTAYVLRRLLDGIDTSVLIPTLLPPHKVSCANRQFGCNKQAHLSGEQRGMLLYNNSLPERVNRVGP